jgi:hypothetical protein
MVTHFPPICGGKLVAGSQGVGEVHYLAEEGEAFTSLFEFFFESHYCDLRPMLRISLFLAFQVLPSFHAPGMWPLANAS